MVLAHEAVLSLDLGSGSLKACVVNGAAEVLSAVTVGYPTATSGDGAATQDPNDWWRCSVEAAAEAVEAAGIPRERYRAIATSGQWATTAPISRDGAPLHPAITWMDTRGAETTASVACGWPRVEGYQAHKLAIWLRVCGGAPVLSGADSFGHIHWLRLIEPAVYARAHALVEPVDYLCFKMSGRLASSPGPMFTSWCVDTRNLGQPSYSKLAARASAIDVAKLPPLIRANSIQGHLVAGPAQAMGLPPGIPVVVGMTDSASAAIGAGCVGEGRLYFYVGTSAWLSGHMPERRIDIRNMVAAMPSAFPDRYAVAAEQGVAGRSLEWFKETLAFPEDTQTRHARDGGEGSAAGGIDESHSPAGDVTHAVSEDDSATDPVDRRTRCESNDELQYQHLSAIASRSPAGANGLIFTPWFAGSMAPSAHGATRSAFLNQSLSQSRGDYVRAVMEGVAQNLAWLIGPVNRLVGASSKPATEPGAESEAHAAGGAPLEEGDQSSPANGSQRSSDHDSETIAAPTSRLLRVAADLRPEWTKPPQRAAVPTPAEAPVLRFVGGAALSDVWCQIFADTLGTTIERPAKPRLANAVGSAMAALVAIGHLRTDQIDDLIPSESTFEPNAEAHALYLERAVHFRAAHRSLTSFYERLNG